MKASAKTLQNFQELLPLVLARRYQTPFLVQVANEVLGEIEKSCESDYLVGELGLVLRDGVTDYALDAAIRHVRGIYEVPAGAIVPDRDHPILHRVFGSTLRLDEPPTLSGDADISGTVPVGATADKTKVYDNGASKFGSYEADELAGRLVRVVHAAGTTEYRILKGNTPASSVVDINGELAALALAGDTYLVTADFFIIEHARYLSRVTTSNYNTAAVDIPQDFEDLFRVGLTYKYHLQADSMSKETQKLEEEYEALKALFRADTTKPRGTSVRNTGRSMPSLFK